MAAAHANTGAAVAFVSAATAAPLIPIHASDGRRVEMYRSVKATPTAPPRMTSASLLTDAPTKVAWGTSSVAAAATPATPADSPVERTATAASSGSGAVSSTESRRYSSSSRSQDHIPAGVTLPIAVAAVATTA